MSDAGMAPGIRPLWPAPSARTVDPTRLRPALPIDRLPKAHRIEMARNTKNSRRITVNDVEYRWCANGDDGYITFTIWPTNDIGSTIHGNFQYHETWLPNGEDRWISTGDQIVVTNRIVRRLIEFAVSKHAYNPHEEGPMLNLRREVDPNLWTTGCDSVDGSQAHRGRLWWTSQGVR